MLKELPAECKAISLSLKTLDHKSNKVLFGKICCKELFYKSIKGQIISLHSSFDQLKEFWENN